MTDTVHLVVTGNSQTHTMSVEEVYEDEDTAKLHRRGLIYEGRARGRHDYVKVITRETRDDAPITPDFDYRLRIENRHDRDEAGVTEWFDTHEQALAHLEEIRDEVGVGVVEAWMQRRNARGRVEETATSTPGSDPWDESWRPVDDPETPHDED